MDIQKLELTSNCGIKRNLNFNLDARGHVEIYMTGEPGNFFVPIVSCSREKLGEFCNNCVVALTDYV